MHIQYPSFSSTGHLEPAPKSLHARTLIEDASSKKVIPIMQPHIFSNEIHVEEIQRRRLQDVLLHEQRRMARPTIPTRTVGFLSAIRNSIGSMLIAAGERINGAPAQAPAAGTPGGAS